MMCLHGDSRSLYIDSRDLPSYSEMPRNQPVSHSSPRTEVEEQSTLGPHALLTQKDTSPSPRTALPTAFPPPPPFPLPSLKQLMWVFYAQLHKLSTVGLTVEPLLTSLINCNAEQASHFLGSPWTPKHSSVQNQLSHLQLTSISSAPKA